MSTVYIRFCLVHFCITAVDIISTIKLIAGYITYKCGLRYFCLKYLYGAANIGSLLLSISILKIYTGFIFCVYKSGLLDLNFIFV